MKWQIVSPEIAMRTVFGVVAMEGEYAVPAAAPKKMTAKKRN